MVLPVILALLAGLTLAILGPTWRWLYAPQPYTRGLALGGAAVALFGLLTLIVVYSGALVNYDADLTATIRQQVPAEVGAFFRGVTMLGDGIFRTLVAVSVGIVLLLRRYRAVLAGWVLALISGELLNLTLKTLVQRDRPNVADPLTAVWGWSFPSGHTMGATILFGLLCYLLVRVLRRPWPYSIAIGTLLLALFIGLSRVILGVHYPLDVLGGWAAGAAWAILWVALIERWR